MAAEYICVRVFLNLTTLCLAFKEKHAFVIIEIL